MALAFSESDIVRDVAIDGSTPSALLAGIHSALTAAGWLSSVITGGYKYRIQSPQGLYCRMKATTTGTRVEVQFTSDDELRSGLVHWLPTSTARVYQIWANICQVFISRPGISDDGNADCVAGGIPWVSNPPGGLEQNERPDDCAVGVPDDPEEDVWWSCGNRYMEFGSNRLNFRNNYRCSVAWSACYKSDLLNYALIQAQLTPSGPQESHRGLRLLPVTEMVNVDQLNTDPAPMRWLDGDPLYLDPLLAWGVAASPGQAARVRGQLWDAVIVSMDHPVDSERDIDGRTWINYTHSTDTSRGRGSFFCTLHLLKVRPESPPPVIANYAY